MESGGPQLSEAQGAFRGRRAQQFPAENPEAQRGPRDRRAGGNARPASRVGGRLHRRGLSLESRGARRRHSALVSAQLLLYRGPKERRAGGGEGIHQRRQDGSSHRVHGAGERGLRHALLVIRVRASPAPAPGGQRESVVQWFLADRRPAGRSDRRVSADRQLLGHLGHQYQPGRHLHSHAQAESGRRTQDSVSSRPAADQGAGGSGQQARP